MGRSLKQCPTLPQTSTTAPLPPYCHPVVALSSCCRCLPLWSVLHSLAPLTPNQGGSIPPTWLWVGEVPRTVHCIAPNLHNSPIVVLSPSYHHPIAILSPPCLCLPQRPDAKFKDLSPPPLSPPARPSACPSACPSALPPAARPPARPSVRLPAQRPAATLPLARADPERPIRSTLHRVCLW